MKCPACNKEIENGSVFCEYCGTRIKKSKKGLWHIIMIIILIAILITLFAVIYSLIETKYLQSAELQQIKNSYYELQEQIQIEQEKNNIMNSSMATIYGVNMNVVYRGINNKVNITIPGIQEDKLSVVCEGGKITKSGKEYVVRPERDGTIKINVLAEMNGKKVTMGSQEYRVKYLPDPKAFLQYVDQNGMPSTIQDGRLGRRFLKDDKTTLIASYGEDELLKANFKITSFSMVTVVGSADSQGGNLSAAQIRLLDRLEGNDYITFKNIRAVGPDGKTRNLGLIQVQL